MWIVGTFAVTLPLIHWRRHIFNDIAKHFSSNLMDNSKNCNADRKCISSSFKCQLSRDQFPYKSQMSLAFFLNHSKDDYIMLGSMLVDIGTSEPEVKQQTKSQAKAFD